MYCMVWCFLYKVNSLKPHNEAWPVSFLESDRQEMVEHWFLFWTKEGMLLLVRLHRMWMSFLYVSLFCALGCPLAGPWLAPGCPSSGPGWPPVGPWLASSGTQACQFFECVSRTEANSSQMTLVWFNLYQFTFVYIYSNCFTFWKHVLIALYIIYFSCIFENKILQLILDLLFSMVPVDLTVNSFKPPPLCT